MTLRKAKRTALENRGWKVGSAEDFLGLSEQEIAYIELKLELSRKLKASRTNKKLTQAELARVVNSSQ